MQGMFGNKDTSNKAYGNSRRFPPELKSTPDMLCMKRVYKDKTATARWSAATYKERFSSRG